MRDVGLGVDPHRELAQHLGAVAGRDHRGVDRVDRDLVGVQVAQVLVDPVGRQPVRDPRRPPGLLLGLRAPRRRGVPVVDDLVVVEDHHARHGGEQPADLRVAPRFVVQLRVLVVGDHLVDRPVEVRATPAGLAPLAQDPLDLGRDDVRVDLVAEQHQHVGPGAVVGHHPPGVRVERVGRQPPGGRVLGGLAAGAEHEADRGRGVVGRPGPDHRRGVRRIRLGPHLRAVDEHLVRGAGVGPQPLDDHQSVVVPVRREGLRGALPAALGADRDQRRSVRFDPHGRPGVDDPAQHRTDQEPCGHASTSTAMGGWDPSCLPRRPVRHP